MARPIREAEQGPGKPLPRPPADLAQRLAARFFERALHGAAGDHWVLGDDTDATFFPDKAGTPAHDLVTRIGIGQRQLWALAE
jgi:hypothetical protein